MRLEGVGVPKDGGWSTRESVVVVPGSWGLVPGRGPRYFNHSPRYSNSLSQAPTPLSHVLQPIGGLEYGLEYLTMGVGVPGRGVGVPGRGVGKRKDSEPRERLGENTFEFHLRKFFLSSEHVYGKPLLNAFVMELGSVEEGLGGLGWS